jgi:hypothetical protein
MIIVELESVALTLEMLGTMRTSGRMRLARRTADLPTTELPGLRQILWQHCHVKANIAGWPTTTLLRCRS